MFRRLPSPIPEPLVWLIGLALAAALAWPLAWAENRLTEAAFKRAFASAQKPKAGMLKPTRLGRLTRLTEALGTPVGDSAETDRPAPPFRAEFNPDETAEAAALNPRPDLLDDLRSRVHPQAAFNSAADEFEDLIATAARRHRVSPLLIKAVIQAESNFNPAVVSHKGAMGLMQVMPATARALGVRNLLDPEMNLEAGVKHLKMLLLSFNDDEHLALAAYNCGTEAMKRFRNEIPPFPETRNYVNRVMSYYSQHLEG